MILSESILGTIYEQTDSAVIISDPHTFRIHAMNEAAKKLFANDPCEYADRLFRLTENELKWYHALPVKAGAFDFLPIELNPNESWILDSYCLPEDNSLYRVDTLNPVGLQNRIAYYCKLELSSNDQRWNNISTQDSERNIQQILKTALFVYGADRAYVVEVDPDIQCLADLYSCSRFGFHDEIAAVRSIGPEGIRSFLEAWEAGDAFIDDHYEKGTYAEWELYGQLYSTIDTWSYMVIPFQKQTGIRCFLCVDNVRQFFGNESILHYLSQLIANCMYAERLRASITSARSLYAGFSHIPESMIRIHLFGGLRVSTNAGEQQDSGAFSSQCGTFFVYLMSNRHRIVPARELAEVLWPDELIDNPYAMIKNVAFRTRKMFENICDKPMIVAGNGTYSINRELNLWIDTEQFEEQCKLAKNQNLSHNNRIKACEQAFSLYQGGMLPNFEAETWLMTRICYYQLLYTDMIRGYLVLLGETNDYIKMFNVAAKAMEQENLDSDIHLTLLECLLKNGKKELARNYYSKAKGQFMPQEDADFRTMWAKYG